MKLTSFRLQNYKSFFDSGELKFTDGFNVIVGQNNSGKSALLQGLSARFSDVAHLSLRTKPTPSAPASPESEAHFSIECEGSELRNLLLNRGAQFHVPAPATRSANQAEADRILGELFSSQRVGLSIRRTGSGVIEVLKTPSFAAYDIGESDMVLQPRPDRSGFQLLKKAAGRNHRAEIGSVIGAAFLEQIYFFHAERLGVAEHGFGPNAVLAPNARNLPEVLNVLQSNAPRFDRFNRYVTQILPTIRRVAVRPKPGTSELQIVVWTVDPATEREDLAISLADSGTGVGQVLAILYVAVTSHLPRTIIIDEPNSFLNPGAAKKLVEILQAFTHLQFIVSTHSPEIVRVAHPRTLSVIHWSDGMSTVGQMEAESMENLQHVLLELGASLSDVFGADRVLWVEGITEELCFRILIERLLKRPLLGTAIAAVRDIGRLTTHRPSAALVWEIYTKLSSAGALMPPALAFSFDREGRSEQEISDIRRRAGNRVRFLPRRMYENYLLNADAIAAVLCSECGSDARISAEAVQEWIDKFGSNFLPNELRGKTLAHEDWVREVNGAGMLDQLFSAVSENRIFYSKARHAVMLTEWLVSNRPESLNELYEHLKKLLDEHQRPSPGQD